MRCEISLATRARSGTALAAVSLALGIAAATIITANAAEQNEEEANLSDRQLLIWTGGEAGEPDPGFWLVLPGLTTAELAMLEEQAEQIAAGIEDATLTPLDVATDPTVPPASGGRPLAITRPSEWLTEKMTPSWGPRPKRILFR